MRAGQKDSIEKAVKSEKFDAVADVLNALQEHDEELIDIIREMKERKGAGEPFNPRRLLEKVKVIGPRINLNRLTESISIEIGDRIGNSWDEWFGLLLRFRAREGHCRVPHPYIEGSFRLGGWVNKQRTNRDTMPAERRQRLDESDLFGIPFEDDWEEGFAALSRFKGREGHCRVSHCISKAPASLGIGLPFSAGLKTRCLLNAGSG